MFVAREGARGNRSPGLGPGNAKMEQMFAAAEAAATTFARPCSGRLRGHEFTIHEIPAQSAGLKLRSAPSRATTRRTLSRISRDYLHDQGEVASSKQTAAEAAVH